MKAEELGVRAQGEAAGRRPAGARAWWGAVLVSVALVVSGCASLPSPEQMQAAVAGYQLPQSPAAGQAMVYVVRPALPGGLIRFNVFVNNQEDASEVGFTRSKQYIYFALPPGTHKIFSKAENWAEIELTVKAGDVAFIQQEVNIGFIMARNTLVRLDDVTGRYHVKNLELGTLHKPK
jgi:hypothetical protein